MQKSDYQITHKDKIVSLLNGLQLSKAKMELTISGDEKTYFSSVLKVIPDADCFYLSTLGNPVVDRRLIDGEVFNLQGRDRGILIKMDALNCAQNSSEIVNDILRVSLPEALEYKQQRESVRIQIHDQNLAVSLTSGETRLKAELLDISYDGCAIGLLSGTGQSLPAVGEVVTLNLDFPDESEAVTVNGRICHWLTDEGKANVGIQFQGLNLKVQNQIDQFILKLQRAACQSRKLG